MSGPYSKTDTSLSSTTQLSTVKPSRDISTYQPTGTQYAGEKSDIGTSGSGLSTVDEPVYDDTSIDHNIVINYKLASQTLTYVLNDSTVRNRLVPLTKQQQQLISIDDIETDLHIVGLDKLLKRYDVSVDSGLTQSEAQHRLTEFGRNILSPPQRQYWLITFLLLFIVGFNWLLLLAGTLDVLSWQPLGAPPNPINWYLGVVLFIIVVVSVAFNSYQTRKSDNVLKSFQNMVPAVARTLRDGRWTDVPAVELQCGDIVQVELGQKIPADMRIVQCNNLKVDNSLLTGESEPVTCTVKCTSANYMESRNLVFFGSNAVEGNAIGVIVRIGDSTVMGKISKLASKSSTSKTTLQIELDRFVLLVCCAALVTGIVCTIGWAAFIRVDYPNYLLYQTLIVDLTSVIIAYVPEGLPVAVTMTLAIVAAKMAKNHVLIKNLSTIETFNTVSIICSDKTGTLTTNLMSAATVVAGLADKMTYKAATQPLPPTDPKTASSQYTELFNAVHLCNAATRISADELKGDSSDKALYAFSEKYVDVVQSRTQNERIGVLPFNSKNKYMISVHNLTDGRTVLYCKGAPEIVFHRCDKMINDDGEVMSMTDANRVAWHDKQAALGDAGERVLGFSMIELDSKTYDRDFIYNFDKDIDDANYPVNQYVWLGYVSLIDPPRPEVASALAKCRGAHIRVAMVTGDHPSTAAAIAKQIGLITYTNVDMFETRTDATGRACLVGQANGKDIGAHTVQQNLTANVVDVPKPAFTSVFPKFTNPFKRKPAAEEFVHERMFDADLPTSTNATKSIADMFNGPQTGAVSPHEVAVQVNEVTEENAWLYTAPHTDRIDRAVVVNGSQIPLFDSMLWGWVLRHNEIVFARTTPEQKLRIVQECQMRGECVAVTGDGVNDAPALRASNLGIAMQAGSEVAREAGHIVLLDNNFNSVVKAVELGRTVFDNLKKVCIYLLPGGTFSEMLTVFVNIYFGIPNMLSNFQMLSVSCFTDVCVSLALVYETAESNVMTRRPRQSGERLVDLKLLLSAYLVPGVITFFGNTISFFWYCNDRGFPFSGVWFAFNGLQGNYPSNYSGPSAPGAYIDSSTDEGANYINETIYVGSTLFFVSTVIAQWFNALAIRTRYTSIIHHNPFFGPTRNLRLLIGMVCAFICLLILTLVPFFQTTFLNRQVPVKYAMAAVGYGSLILCVDESRKYIVRNYPSSTIAQVAW